jgi:hypothetical protein
MTISVADLIIIWYVLTSVLSFSLIYLNVLCIIHNYLFEIQLRSNRQTSDGDENKVGIQYGREMQSDIDVAAVVVVGSIRCEEFID